MGGDSLPFRLLEERGGLLQPVAREAPQQDA